jgi:hypothetical protein
MKESMPRSKADTIGLTVTLDGKVYRALSDDAEERGMTVRDLIREMCVGRADDWKMQQEENVKNTEAAE